MQDTRLHTDYPSNLNVVESFTKLGEYLSKCGFEKYPYADAECPETKYQLNPIPSRTLQAGNMVEFMDLLRRFPNSMPIILHSHHVNEKKEFLACFVSIRSDSIAVSIKCDDRSLIAAIHESIKEVFQASTPSEEKRKPVSRYHLKLGEEKLDPRLEQCTAAVIRPEEPFSNLIRLRHILRESDEFIWWADVHFHARALEELASVDATRVHQVRILSGPAHVDERAKRDFVRFREEMERKGVEAEWRVLSRFAHNRFIITKSACFNVPPVNSILQGLYGEMLLTPNRPPFDDWWAEGKSADTI